MATWWSSSNLPFMVGLVLGVVAFKAGDDGLLVRAIGLTVHGFIEDSVVVNDVVSDAGAGGIVARFAEAKFPGNDCNMPGVALI